MKETELRDLMVSYGRSLFERGYGCGTSGNLSARLDDGTLVLSPTNMSLGGLKAEELTRVTESGRHLSGEPGTKEAWLHLAAYRARPDLGAVVHLHSTYAVALSCLEGLNLHDALPAITPYAVMRFGAVALVPYFRPGDENNARLIEELAHEHRAILLANHGPVVLGNDLPSAIAAAEELEETSKLFFILRDRPHRTLTKAQVQDLIDVFGKPRGSR
jgi:ribulose-5-phosphate 4-epimerase/fuculose-1-phosphate aldolase